MIAALLDAGHDSAAVMDRYSLDEIEAHYHALLRHRAKMRQDFIVDTMVASGNLSKNARAKHLRSLRTTAERISREMKRQRSPMELLFGDLGNLKARAEDSADGDDRRIPRKHRNRQGLR